MPRQWYVGGYVRDEILGIKSKDIDIMVELGSFEELEEWVASHCSKIYERRPDKLIIRALGPQGPVDYNLPRTESAYSDNRSPDSVEIGTFEEDLSRRDFTCNALAKDVETGELIDLHGGLQDIKARQLRMVGNAADRLAEDHLRIVRAIRFCITKDFEPIQGVHLALMNRMYAEKLLTIPIERIQVEMQKALAYDTPKTLKFLREIHVKYTDVIFSRGLWLLPTLAKKK